MKNLFLVLVMATTMIACNGGGGSSSYSTYTHADAAEDFVDNLYDDSNGTFDAYVVKAYTVDGYGSYVVIKEYGGSYYAVDIDSYYNSDNAESYFYDTYYSDSMTVYSNFDGTYSDYSYNYVFEKTTASKKNLTKAKGIVEAAKVEARAQYFNSELQLSMERSREVARLTTNWKKASMKSMTNAEHDNYATEILGFSLTSAKKTLTEQGSAGIQGLVNDAAAINGITPEHASKLLTKVFGL